MDRVAIVLCTFNGEKYLAKQLTSIDNQTYKYIDVYIGDDGSTDRTLKIIQNFIFKNINSVNLFHSNYSNFSKNFFATLFKIKKKYTLYFFCDQDDIWHPEKVEKYINIYKKDYECKPFLICSRTELIDEHGKTIGKSPIHQKKPSIRNALVQSIAGGNTMAINHKVNEIILKTKNNNAVSHDWLIYLLTVFYLGKVVYLKKGYTKYRQHSNNTIGSNQSIEAFFKRVFLAFNGQFSEWTNKNIAILENLDLPSESRKSLATFKRMKSSNFFERILALFKLRVYRHTFLSTINMVILILFRKI